MTSTIKLRAVPPAQRAHSEAWMREWALEEQLSQALQEETPADEGAQLAAADPAAAPTAGPRPATPLNQPFPVPGQIRLLPPALAPGVFEPVYVGILSNWENNLLLAAPFSGFQHPATRGEWLTGRTEPPLAVLCPWCAVSVSPLLMMKSWHVGDFTAEQREAAWQVFRHAATGAPIPETLQDQVGAPIVHPLDPRIRYQRILSARMSRIVQLTARTQNADIEGKGQEPIAFAQAREQLAMAAEDRDHPSIPLLIHCVSGDRPALRAAGTATLMDRFQALPDEPTQAQGRFSLRLAGDYAAGPQPTQGDLVRLVRRAKGQPEETLAVGTVFLPPAGDREPFCLMMGAWSVLQPIEFGPDVFLIICKL